MMMARVALCDLCWMKRSPNREPGRVRRSEDSECGPLENCYICGNATLSGIYDRLDSDKEPPTCAVPITRERIVARIIGMAKEFSRMWKSIEGTSIALCHALANEAALLEEYDALHVRMIRRDPETEAETPAPPSDALEAYERTKRAGEGD